jgi:hypothetical protein
MEIWENLPYLSCKHCEKPIPLPPSRHPDTSQGLGSWPKDALPRNFACHRCMHVYEYSASELHPPPVPREASRKQNKPHNVFCIELPCGAGNCASQLRIRILAAFDTGLIQDPTEVAALSEAHAIRCDIGHMQRDGKRQSAGVAIDDATLDPDWKYWEGSSSLLREWE